MQITKEEWTARQAQAEKLVELETECSMCGGTGGWPGLNGLNEWVHCKPCDGTGSSTPSSTSLN
jgi:DnaJ-class molecular chaperone